jgi:hypothetical protein
MHDRRDGVEEGERVLAGLCEDRLGERDDVSGPVAMMTLDHDSRRPAIDFAALDRDQRVRLEGAVTSAEKLSRSTASAEPAGTGGGHPSR